MILEIIEASVITRLMTTTKNKLSETYSQLSKLFELLENAHFEEGADYGENLVGCFEWFVAPAATTFLEMRFNSELLKLLANGRFSCKFNTWQGFKTPALEISLVM
jgi:hypothetical protein